MSQEKEQSDLTQSTGTVRVKSLHTKIVKKSSRQATSTPSKEVPLTFGARLKTERESQGLSLMDVSDRLYLSDAIITLIEQDEYYDKTPEVFMCGHIRAYAKLLGIPKEEVDQKFSELGIVLQRGQINLAIFELNQEEGHHRRLRWAVYVIIVVVVISMIIGYFFHRVNSKIDNGALIGGASPNTLLTAMKTEEPLSGTTEVSALPNVQSKESNTEPNATNNSMQPTTGTYSPSAIQPGQNTASEQTSVTSQVVASDASKTITDLPWLTNSGPSPHA